MNGPSPNAQTKVPIPTIPPQRNAITAHTESVMIRHQKYGIGSFSSMIMEIESYGAIPKFAVW